MADFEARKANLRLMKARKKAGPASSEASEFVAMKLVPAPAPGSMIKPHEGEHKRQLKAARAELSRLKLGALQKKASAAGVDGDKLEAALDADAPKEEVITLLLELMVPEVADDGDTAAAEAKRVKELTAELSAMKLSALQKRAMLEGLDVDVIGNALDSDTPKTTLVQVIVVASSNASESVTGEQLCAQLMQLKVSELLQRARTAGVEQEVLDETADSNDQKGVLVSLVLETAFAAASTSASRANQKVAEENLWTELQALKVSELLKRARAVGIDQEAIDDAADCENQKQALASLLLDAEMGEQPKPQPQLLPLPPPGLGLAQSPKPTARPHFRAHDQNSSAKDNGFFMLSYQWDDQPLVIEVRKALQAHGLTCWMDIDGGMKRDIFDSMAEGVQGATCIVPFMTQKYQISGKSACLSI